MPKSAKISAKKVIKKWQNKWEKNVAKKCFFYVLFSAVRMVQWG